MINCFIHMLMYTHFLFAGLGIKSQLSKMLSKYLTLSQMTQFVIILCHSVFHIVFADRYWSLQLAVIQTVLMIQMLYMFSDFFKTKYSEPPTATEVKKAI